MSSTLSDSAFSLCLILCPPNRETAFRTTSQMDVLRRTFLRAPAGKKPDDRQFKVGDRVTVSLSAGRVGDAIVKAIINRTDGGPTAGGLREGRDRAGLLVAGSRGLTCNMAIPTGTFLATYITFLFALSCEAALCSAGPSWCAHVQRGSRVFNQRYNYHRE